MSNYKTRQSKQTLYHEVYMQNLFKVLGNINRIRILKILNTHSDFTVNDIAQDLDLEQPAVSRHLVDMRKQGIIQAKQDKQYMRYEIKDNTIKQLITLCG